MQFAAVMPSTGLMSINSLSSNSGVELSGIIQIVFLESANTLPKKSLCSSVISGDFLLHTTNSNPSYRLSPFWVAIQKKPFLSWVTETAEFWERPSFTESYLKLRPDWKKSEWICNSMKDVELKRNIKVHNPSKKVLLIVLSQIWGDEKVYFE